MVKEFTVTVFTENHIGLLQQISIVFTRRKINIESLTVSESHIKGIHCFTIVVNITLEKVIQVVKQIEKLIDVLKSFYYSTENLVVQEVALYKIEAKAIENDDEFARLIRNNNARILFMNKEYIVIEKTGYKKETQAMLEVLRPLGVLEFVRSGRVAITKPMKELTVHIKEKQEAHKYDFVEAC